jgi:two-component system, OmpR family, alkaline phosphatase synthesis response regulator PhoP
LIILNIWTVAIKFSNFTSLYKIFKKLKRIMVVDDDANIRELLVFHLKSEAYSVMEASDGLECISKMESFNPHLFILDLMMPNLNGIETALRIRKNPITSQAHIIFLTARDEEYSEVAAFQAGANDYLIKPIKLRALSSRLESIFKAKNEYGLNQNDFEINGLVIKYSNFSVLIESKESFLPKKEFKILAYLAKKPNIVCNREELLNAIWGQNTIVVDRTIDVHIRKLREKIGEKHIKTLKGVGYLFQSS